MMSWKRRRRGGGRGGGGAGGGRGGEGKEYEGRVETFNAFEKRHKLDR